MSELELLEELVAAAFTSAEPQAALAEAARDERLSPDLRARLAGADADGVGIAGLLVVKLRFERVVQGSRLAGEWFERDPAGFARAFRRYHAEVVPRESMPGGEGAAFDGWAEPG